MFAVRSLRRSCERRLSNIPWPAPFTLDGFVAAIGEHLGRTIHLVPIDESGDMRTACGLRVKTPSCTYILYRRRSSAIQDEHIAFHELTHEVFDHTTDLSPDEMGQVVPPGVRQVLQELTSETIIQARASRYETLQEREAELGALILGRMRGERCSGAGDDLVSQLQRSLCHPVAPPRRTC
ncbi:hypothetical protein [Streptomyces lydicus]|uniref:hypothetical protein n=1 Tax=Streptomyces lydicus TaxID=47763 RepID=UPI0013E96D7B|nr:hypothetical protein [Streptomyces lydicus]MCZ1012084.1 hypothetical protein [Streptomyces lydicus]